METCFTLFGKNVLIFVDICGIIYSIKLQKRACVYTGKEGKYEIFYKNDKKTRRKSI